MSAGCEYMGGSRRSGAVSSAVGVLEMSMARGVRSVGVVCKMRICWTRDVVGAEEMRLGG